MTTEAMVLDALQSVRDPELDQGLTELNFVAGVIVERTSVEVRLRLPTYFCAPNFAYLMASNARTALLTLPDIHEARVVLVDHFTSDEINAGVGKGHGFEETFAGQANGELDELRDLFRRKSFIARQEKLCRNLIDGGVDLMELAAMRLDEVPESQDARTYLERRRELGLDMGPEASFLVDPAGRPIPYESLADHLRFARTVRLSIEGNAGVCRGLLATRYGIEDPEEVTA